VAARPKGLAKKFPQLKGCGYYNNLKPKNYRFGSRRL
jgi:hypothetical protein